MQVGDFGLFPNINLRNGSSKFSKFYQKWARNSRSRLKSCVMLGRWQPANVHLLFPCPEMCQNTTGEPQKSSLIHSTVTVTFHVPGAAFSARDTTVLL